ncbi:MAG: endonuclease III [Nitrococcus sp.]|nr:endonuclease III [Nitrococcus sp.]
MNRQKCTAIFQRLQAANPSPRTELRFRTPFELLIAVMLSAQATDRSVNKATQRLFAVADTPETMLALGEERLKHYIQTIGLFNSKARNIIATCRILVQMQHGRVPDNRNDLESLPGVGRKTANVILNTAFGQPTLAVDTHIFRLANRIGLARGRTPRQVEDQLIRRIPKQYLLDAHHWLILHGRYVCTARNPRCAECVLYDLCELEGKAANANN